MIDFGDVMTGRGEYDLLGPSALMAGGMPRRVQSLFEGFGYSASDITPDLKRRLMALMLHRFGNPTKQICIEGWQQSCQPRRIAGFALADLSAAHQWSA